MFKAILKNKLFLAQLKNEVLKERTNAVLLVIAIFGITLLDIILPRLLGELSNVITSNHFELNFIIFFIFIFLLRMCCSFVLHYQTSFYSNLLTLRIKRKLLFLVIDLPENQFSKFQRGDMIQRIFNELGLLQGKLIIGFAFFLKDIIFLSALLINLFLMSLPLFISLMTLGIILYSYNFIVMNKNIRRSSRINELNTAQVTFFWEVINGKNDIHVYKLQSFVKEKLESLSEKLVYEHKRNARQSGQQAFFFEFILGSFLLIVLLILFFQKSNIGFTITLITYMVSLIWPMREIINYLNSLNTIVPSLQRVESLLKETEIGNHNNRVFMSNVKTPVLVLLKVHDLDFQRETDGTILFKKQNHSFTEGIHLITGKNGVGKTTFLQLLMGIKKPSSGEISILTNKGVEFNNDSLIRMVQQDLFLFNDTILNNLRIANPRRSDDEILKLIKNYELEDFFAQLPLGINTIVGEYGEALSAGEKQIICILRALLVDPLILLLDEVTSNLDEGHRVKLLTKIAYHRKDKITILVSHDNNIPINFTSTTNF